MIEVPLRDGTVIEVNTNDPAVARAAAARYLTGVAPGGRQRLQPAAVAPLYGGDQRPALGTDWSAWLQNPANADLLREATNPKSKLVRDARRQGYVGPEAVAEYWYQTYPQAGRPAPPQIRAAGPTNTGNDGEGVVDSGDALDLVFQSPQLQFADEDLARDLALSDETYEGELGLVEDTLGDLDNLAGEERGAVEGLLDDTFGGRLSRADEARAALEAEALASRDRTLDLLRQDYDQRRDISGREISAWEALADEAQRDAIDQVFSRGGIDGRIGMTRAGVADVAQDYARQRALYGAERERLDFDPLSQGRLQAEGEYGDRRYSARDAWNAARRGADAERAEGRMTALDAYYAARNSNARGAAGQRQQLFRERQGRAGTIASNWSGARDAAFGDFQRYWGADADAGQGAASGFGRDAQGYTTAQYGLNYNRARFNSDATVQRANINTNLWNNLASAAGTAAGAWAGGRGGGGRGSMGGALLDPYEATRPVRF